MLSGNKEPLRRGDVGPKIPTDGALTIDDTAAWTPGLRGTVEEAINSYAVPGQLGSTIKIERFGDRLRFSSAPTRRGE